MNFLQLACFVLGCVTLAKGSSLGGFAFPEDINGKSAGKIIQGWPAVNGQFPHQGLLILRRSDGANFICGASLISTRWVMTAAHCVKDRVEARVHLGHVNYASSPVIVTTNLLHFHPQYNENNLNHDIALINLNRDVALTNNIRTVRPPSSTTNAFVGSQATASGYGAIVNGGSVTQSLNYVNLTIISNSVCSTYFSIIISSTICGQGINSPAQGVCHGDSGGPLIIRGATDTLIGVVSFVSTNGCSASYPSGFVRPNHYLAWIKQVSGLDFTRDE